MPEIDTTSHTRTRKRGFGALAAAVLAALLLAACGTGNADSSDGTHVTFGVGSPTLTETTAPYSSVPEQMGYWKEQGIDVEVQPTQGATASMQLLVAGKADIVNGGTASFYQAAEKNPNIRVVALQKANIWHVVVPEGSDITSLDDLKGKTIGAQSLSSAGYLFGKAAIATAGLNPDEDVQWLPVGVGAQAAEALQSGQIAAYATYDGPSGVLGNVLGKKMVNLPTPLDKVPGLQGIATTEKFLKNHPDTVTKFLIGMNQGAIFSAENPGSALQIHWEVHPDQKPRNVSTDAAIQEMLPVVDSRFRGAAESGPNGLIGGLPMADVQQSIDFQATNNIIDKPLEAEEIVDLSLSQNANQFDAAAIRDQAQEWKP